MSDDPTARYARSRQQRRPRAWKRGLLLLVVLVALVGAGTWFLIADYDRTAPERIARPGDTLIVR